jgi:hypothetical protein
MPKGTVTRLPKVSTGRVSVPGQDFIHIEAFFVLVKNYKLLLASALQTKFSSSLSCSCSYAWGNLRCHRYLLNRLGALAGVLVAATLGSDAVPSYFDGGSLQAR